MAQPYSSREDLKGDLLQDWLKKGLDWVAVNRQTFFSVVGTIAAGGVVAAFIFTNMRNVRKEAWQRYSAGENWMYARNAEQALKFFDDVTTNYSHTPAAVYALLSKGDILYLQKKYPESIQAYQECLEKSPPRIILPFVQAGLGAAQEDHGDYAGAVAAYKNLIAEFPDHYLAPKIYESLARVYELSLNPDAAKETYEKIITMFPGTAWAEKARQRYQSLAPQPFQTPEPAVPAPAGTPAKP